MLRSDQSLKEICSPIVFNTKGILHGTGSERLLVMATGRDWFFWSTGPKSINLLARNSPFLAHPAALPPSQRGPEL